MNKETIAFKKGIVVPPNDKQDNRIMVATVNAELMRLGFMLDEDAFKALSEADPKFIVDWIKTVSKYIVNIIGDGSNWKPLHAGFPQSVMDKTTCELYMDAILHYWSDATYYPKEELAEAGYEFEYTKYTMISTGTEADFMAIFISLISVNQSITPADMRVIEWFADTYSEEELVKIMPKVIPFKENLTVLAAKGLPVPVKTPTDVLRIAHYMSGNATDLVVPPKMICESQWSKNKKANPAYTLYKFGPFTRKQRHILLSLLDNCAYAKEMVLRIEMWKRLGELLHPGEYTNKYPKAAKAFDLLRNKKVRSWYGDVDKAFGISFDTGITKLAERPGEFARRLDVLLRVGPGKQDPSRILLPFKECGAKVSNKVLFELYTHFQNRSTAKTPTIKIKGTRITRTLNHRPAIQKDILEDLTSTIWGIFSDKFALLPTLGSVWIDEELRKIPAPTDMRTISDSLVIVMRGQRNPFTEDKKVLRSYIHWTAGVDIDLSMEFGNLNNNEVAHCSYTSLRPHSSIYHSGDVIPNVKGNHAEYVDIIFNKCPYDYALLTAHVFRGNSLKQADAHIGFMERDTAGGDETWRPSSVVNAIQMHTEGTSLVLALIDIKKKEWILVDEDPNVLRPVSTGSLIKNVINRVAVLPTVSAYDILAMHAEARGKIVADVEQADIVFKFEDFNTSYEKLLSYML